MAGSWGVAALGATKGRAHAITESAGSGTNARKLVYEGPITAI